MRKEFYYVAFAISGFAAIVYQILWIRLLALAFGGVTVVIASVASLFLAGLAAGAFLGGRGVDFLGRSGFKRILAFYITLELLIASFGVVNFNAFSNFATSPGAWRLPLGFGLVFVQALVAGATWPAMFKIIVGLGERWSVGGFIAFVNTLGGALGAFASSFLLIGNVGIVTTLTIALASNMLVAFGVLALARASRGVVMRTTSEGREERSLAGKNELLILFVLFLTGFVGMALEIFWMRAFALVVGGSIYSFSLVLTSVLLGLALGGLFVGLWRGKFKVGGLFLILLLEAIFVLVGVILLPKVPHFLAEQYTTNLSIFVMAQLERFFYISAVVFLVSFFSGMALPLGISLLEDKFGKAGSFSGRAYAVNTLGAVLGGFLAALVLIQTLGLKTGFIALGSLLILLVILYQVREKTFSRLAFTIAVFLSLGAWAIAGWDEYAISSGSFIYGKRVLEPTSGTKLLSYKDGREATVSTTWHDGVTTLRINGKADASNGPDMGTQVVLGHVPILLHQEPKKVLIIGLGSGVTAGSIATHSRVEEITTVEIEPEVVEVARKYFGEENLGILDNPKIELVVGDARNFLLETDQKFDVITAEPSNPWLAGQGNLFTKEYFELGKSKLEDDGVFFQWLHLYNLRPEEVKSIAKTFTEVFPYVQVWTSTDPVDIFLAGKTEPFVLYWDRFQEALGRLGVRESLARRGYTDEIRLFSLIWGGNNKARLLGDGGRVNTDRNPSLEFQAPYGLYKNTLPDNFGLLLDIFQDDPDLFRIEGMPEDKRRSFERARQARRLLFESKKKFSEGSLDQAISLAEQGLERDSESPHLKRYLSELYTILGGASSEPARLLERAVFLDPVSYLAHVELSRHYIEAEKYEEAREFLSRAKEKFPWSGSLVMFEGILAGISKDNERAEELLLKAKELEPWNVLIYNNLAHLYYTQNKRELAIEEWEASLKLNPNQKEIRELLRATENLKKLK